MKMEKAAENKKGFLLFIFLLLFLIYSSVAGFSQQSAPPPEKQPSPQPFGYDIFRPLPEPIIEGPVDEQYLLSPGDEIIITVWGQLSLKYLLAVSEDGYIDIPDEGGRVFTNGVSLKELKKMVTESLSRIYSSYINLENPSSGPAFVDVKLAKVRKLLVYVVGEVKNRGAYTISSGIATLLNLLTNAGGVEERGSLRDIRIRRANGTVDMVDFYDLLITGKIDTKKTQIRYGDYIIVPIKQKSVAIKGEVKREGIYEVIGNEGIKELINFAGGLTSNAYLKRCQVRRFEVNVGEKFIDLDLESVLSDPEKNFPLMDRDEVTILPSIVVRRRMVEIRGDGIKRPGVYQYSPGMTVRDLIEQAEGLREHVYLERADLVRTGEDFSKKLTVFSPKELYKEERPGVYVFAGDKSAEEKNFRLRELDEVIIYSSFALRGKDKHVTLEGHIKEPGTYILAENMSLYDLMFSRGGFNDETFRKRAFLDLAHIFRKTPGELKEQVLTFSPRKLLDGKAEANIRIEDGDRIVVYSYDALEVKPMVTIDGLVKRPGAYELAEGMTLGDLILVAGGLRPEAYRVEAAIARREPPGDDSENKKGEEKIATVIIPISGDIARIPDEVRTPLKPFDKILIRNLYQWEPLSVVSVKGQVKSPGSYSLESRQERISQVMRRAGGLKNEAFAEGAYLMRQKDIVRMSETKTDELEKIAINLREALQNPARPYDLVLKDGDMIFVPNNPGTVEVRGAVRKPGILQYREGKGIGYYVDLCGGWMGDKDNVVINLPNGSAKKVKKFLFLRISPKVLPGSVIEVPVKPELKKLKADED